MQNRPPPRRAQDDTCQTVTGIAVAAQDLRPDTWCRESPENLGRMAAAAVTAGGREHGRENGGGREGRNGGRSSASSRRVGQDGLRRCGRPRPQMFRPTVLARLKDGCVRARPKGEVRKSHRTLLDLGSCFFRGKLKASLENSCLFRSTMETARRTQ